MPTVFRDRGFRFFFYSNEGSPREPIHIHVVKGDAEAKFWVEDQIALERSDGFDAKTLRGLAEVVELNRREIEDKWREHFG